LCPVFTQRHRAVKDVSVLVGVSDVLSPLNEEPRGRRDRSVRGLAQVARRRDRQRALCHSDGSRDSGHRLFDSEHVAGAVVVKATQSPAKAFRVLLRLSGRLVAVKARRPPTVMAVFATCVRLPVVGSHRQVAGAHRHGPERVRARVGGSE